MQRMSSMTLYRKSGQRPRRYPTRYRTSKVACDINRSNPWPKRKAVSLAPHRPKSKSNTTSARMQSATVGASSSRILSSSITPELRIKYGGHGLASSRPESRSSKALICQRMTLCWIPSKFWPAEKNNIHSGSMSDGTMGCTKGTPGHVLTMCLSHIILVEIR